MDRHGNKSTQKADIKAAHKLFGQLDTKCTMEKIRTRPWDSAEHLKTEDDIAEYFAAFLLEGSDDLAFIAHALDVIARARGMA